MLKIEGVPTSLDTNLMTQHWKRGVRGASMLFFYCDVRNVQFWRQISKVFSTVLALGVRNAELRKNVSLQTIWCRRGTGMSGELFQMVLEWFHAGFGGLWPFTRAFSISLILTSDKEFASDLYFILELAFAFATRSRQHTHWEKLSEVHSNHSFVTSKLRAGLEGVAPLKWQPIQPSVHDKVKDGLQRTHLR